VLQKNDISLPKWAWLLSRDCFKILPFAVMQRVARVCQRQLILVKIGQRSGEVTSKKIDCVSAMCVGAERCVLLKDEELAGHRTYGGHELL